MADLGINPVAWTDPRLMLAQQLMQSGADNSPLRSGTQELARALQPMIGAMMLKGAQDNRVQALQQLYPGMGGTGQPAQQESPGLFERIGNFFSGGSSADAPQGQTSGSPSPAGESQSPAPQIAAGGPAPTASPGASSSASSAAPDASTPAPQQSVTGVPTPGTAGPFAQQIYRAYRMIQVGRERNLPDFVMQGTQLLQSIQQKQAEVQLEAAKDGRSLNIGPDGSVSISAIPGYDTTMAGTEAAKIKASELAKVDPSVTQGRIGQTNAINTQTMGTEAAKAGAIAGADANARNVSDLNYAGPKAFATASGTNQANAVKPLTPAEKNDQEQKVGEQFRNSETAKEYFQTAQGYKNVMAAAQATDKASDINLIDGLVKMFNPGATVRQGSFDTFMEHSQGLPDNVIGLVKSWYGNGQHLAPETRVQLLDQAKNRMDASRINYRQQADSLGAQVQAQGLNPKNVIPAYVDPLTAFEELQRRRAAAAQQQAPAP